MTTNTTTQSELRLYNLNYSNSTTLQTYEITSKQRVNFYNYALGRALEYRYDRRRLIRQSQILSFEDFVFIFTKLIQNQDFLIQNQLDFETNQLILHPTYTSSNLNNIVPLLYDNKLNHIDTVDGISVLSKYTSTFYKKLNHIPVQANYDFINLIDYFENSNSFNKFYSKKHFNHNLSDISFTPIQKDAESTLNTYSVVEMKAPCSGKNVDLSLSKIPKPKYLKGDSFFAPVLIPVKSYDFASNSFYDAYIFTFNIDVQQAKIFKYTKIRNYIESFIENSYEHSSIYFSDKEKYSKLKGLKLFLLNKNVEISQPMLTLIQSSKNIKEPKLPNIVSSEDFLATAKQIDYPLNIIAKEKTLQKKIKTVKTFFNSTNSNLQIADFKTKIGLCDDAIRRYKNQIAEYQDYLQKKVNELNEVLEQRDSYILNVCSYMDDLKMNSLKGRALQRAYSSFREEKLKLAKSLPFKQDETLSNMLKYFEIIDIVFEDNSKWTNLNDFSEEYLQNNKIKEVNVATNTPNKITLVNKKESVVGGPYILKITKGSLNIKARDKSTYLGLKERGNNNYTYFVHPHAGSRASVDQIFIEWCNACLGEASGLLYKAFEQNSLKMILLAADCWLNSANQADTWGKHYIYFTPWKDYQDRMSFIQSTSLEEIDVYEEELKKYECKDLPFTLTLDSSLIKPQDEVTLEEKSELQIQPNTITQETEEETISSSQTEYVPYISNTWS
jgi:hypothetical protein